MKYDFTGLRGQHIKVEPELLYETTENQLSYGFLTEKNRRAEKRLQIAEINSGMDLVYWYGDTEVTCIKASEHGCFTEWHGEGEIPLTFVTDVEKEGNYEVMVSLYAEEDCEEVFLFLGRRRLAWHGKMKKGENFTQKFVTNICPIIPRTYTEAMEDLTLDVTLIGRGICMSAIEVIPWNGKTLYIAGDSTVTDQSCDYPYLSGQSYCGWGQMLSYFLGDEMAVSNHAHSGLTTESFRSEKHYDILIERIKPGDICLFQFGHNDQKLMHLMAEGGYRDRLLQYIDEINKKGATPVLVTPLARNSWRGDTGTYNDLLEPYASACKNIAEEKHIPLLDLHEKSMHMVMKYGRESAKRFFFPSDYTHSNDYGAYCFAKFVYEEMCNCGLVEEQLKPKWEPPMKLPVLQIPEEYMAIQNPMQEQLFQDLERPEEMLTRVEALDFVIQTMHFFPTNVYNDMFEDVIGHETYAGTVECAWQNGLIPEGMILNKKFEPQKNITGGEFLEILVNGYKSRKAMSSEDSKILPDGFVPEQEISRALAARMCKMLQI